jgi:acrylyl-CoA reductase (NADPH)/3-hydroxypropionyl-CoA dehydratase/3-hydroxypropionyl-CoA synthetase
MTDVASDWGRIEGADQEKKLREAALADPGTFHGDIAAAELHWFHEGAWWRRDPIAGTWSGFDATTGEPRADAPPGDWRPWTAGFDDSRRPLLPLVRRRRDQRLLQRGRPAPPRRRGRAGRVHLRGRPLGPVEERRPGRARGRGDGHHPAPGCIETVVRAEVMTGLGLKTGDRVAFNLPNILEQLYYTRGRQAPRHHLHAGLRRLLRQDAVGPHLRRRRQDRRHRRRRLPQRRGGPLQGALHRRRARQLHPPAHGPRHPPGGARRGGPRRRGRCDSATPSGPPWPARSPSSEATSCGSSAEPSPQRPRSRPSGARRCGRRWPGPSPRPSTIVERSWWCRYTGQDIVEQPRDRWSDGLVARRGRRVLAGPRAGFDDGGRWRPRTTGPLAGAGASHPAVPQSRPTGRCSSSTPPAPPVSPRAWCHCHGGWLAGIAHTMRMVFDAGDDDRIYVIADPGWITGQSYLIAAPLAVGMTSIVAEGSPLFPHAGRFSLDHRPARGDGVQGRLDLPQVRDDRPVERRTCPPTTCRPSRRPPSAPSRSPRRCSSSRWRRSATATSTATGPPSTAASCSPAPGATSTTARGRREDLAPAVDRVPRCGSPRSGTRPAARRRGARRAGGEGRARRHPPLPVPRAHHLGRPGASGRTDVAR